MNVPNKPIDTNTNARATSAHIRNLIRTTYLVSDLPAAIARNGLCPDRLFA